MDNQTYGKRIRIGDREVYVHGDKEYVDIEFDKLHKMVFSTNEELQQTEGATGMNSNAVTKKISLREFVNIAKAKTKKDNLALVGYYFERHLGQESYTVDELVSKSAESKILMGKNVHRDLGKLMEDAIFEKYGKRDGNDAFRLTIRGEKYVEEELLGGTA